MSFEKIESRARAPMAITSNPDGVAVALHRNAAVNARLAIYIGRNILALMGLTRASRVNVEEGTGVDVGCFRITPAPEDTVEGFTLTTHGSVRDGVPMLYVAVAVTKLKTLPTTMEPRIAENAAFQRFGSTLTVLVPWCNVPKVEPAIPTNIKPGGLL